MFKVSSQTMTEDYKAESVPQIEFKFQITNGNIGEKVISDPLLDSYARAEERAMSEFLKTSYKTREVRFTTWRTDLTKNMIINIKGLPYIVKSLSTIITGTSIKTTVRAVRYE